MANELRSIRTYVCLVEDLIYQHAVIIYILAIKSTSEIRQKAFHAGVLYVYVINLAFFLKVMWIYWTQCFVTLSVRKGQLKSRLMILMIHSIATVCPFKGNEPMLCIYFVASCRTVELPVSWCNGFKSHLHNDIVDSPRITSANFWRQHTVRKGTPTPHSIVIWMKLKPGALIPQVPVIQWTYLEKIELWFS